MNNPLVQPDPGLFIWTILTFVVLVGLLAKFGWKPLLKALESRQEAIKKSLDDAERAKQELARLQSGGSMPAPEHAPARGAELQGPRPSSGR